MPGAHEVPPIRIGHLRTKVPATEYGMKGMGEGGAIDVTPWRVMAAIAAAAKRAAGASGR